jgi:hypothetical protein
MSRAQPIDRFRLLVSLDRAAVRRLEGNGAAVDGDLVICPAGTTFHVTQGLMALRFWDTDEVIVFPERDVVRMN